MGPYCCSLHRVHMFRKCWYLAENLTHSSSDPCFSYPNSGYTYRVYLGKHNLRNNEAGAIAISPAKIIVHEAWDSYRIRYVPFVSTLLLFVLKNVISWFLSHSNDIALIKLSTPVQKSDSIMPACLPTSGEILPHNSPCYVTGWGRLWSKRFKKPQKESVDGPVGTKWVLFFSLAGGPIADILQQARLPVVGHDTCSRYDWWGSLVTTNMVCAGGDGQLASCNVSHFFCMS